MNTGEVVGTREGQAFVSGDAVAVAARLEEAATPGEILIGETTYRLVSDAVTAEPLAPLALKGKAEPVRAWRVREMAPLDRGGRAASTRHSSDAGESSTCCGRCSTGLLKLGNVRLRRSSAWPASGNHA